MMTERKNGFMTKVILMLIAALLLTGAACAEAAPPAFILDCDGVTETPVAANYSWTYPSGNTDEWQGVEACGMAPTDPAVFESFDHVLLTEDRTYQVEWVGIPADELIAFSWDIAVFADQEHIDDHQENAEIILGKTGGAITLKPDRIYDFQARWSDETVGHGVAHYYLVTERLIMDDGPGSMMLGGWEPAAAEAGQLPDDAQAAFDRAMEGLVGAEYTPVALLSRQIVAGTNYCILCQISPVVPNPVPNWALVYIYADLQGNAMVTNVYELYIAQHAEPAQ